MAILSPVQDSPGSLELLLLASEEGGVFLSVVSPKKKFILSADEEDEREGEGNGEEDAAEMVAATLVF